MLSKYYKPLSNEPRFNLGLGGSDMGPDYTVRPDELNLTGQPTRGMGIEIPQTEGYVPSAMGGEDLIEGMPKSQWIDNRARQAMEELAARSQMGNVYADDQELDLGVEMPDIPQTGYPIADIGYGKPLNERDAMMLMAKRTGIDQFRNAAMREEPDYRGQAQTDLFTRLAEAGSTLSRAMGNVKGEMMPSDVTPFMQDIRKGTADRATRQAKEYASAPEDMLKGMAIPGAAQSTLRAKAFSDRMGSAETPESQTARTLLEQLGIHVDPTMTGDDVVRMANDLNEIIKDKTQREGMSFKNALEIAKLGLENRKQDSKEAALPNNQNVTVNAPQQQARPVQNKVIQQRPQRQPAAPRDDRKDLSSAEIENVNDFENTLSTLHKLKGTVKPNFVGMKNRLQDVPLVGSSIANSMRTPDEQVFHQNYMGFYNAYKKLISGSAVSDKEKPDIISSLPDTTTNYQAFVKRVNDMIAVVTEKRNRYLENLKKGNRKTENFGQMEQQQAPQVRRFKP